MGNQSSQKHKPITLTNPTFKRIDNALRNDYYDEKIEIEPPKQNNKNEIERLLQLSLKLQHKFVLKWFHIENAIKQELYDKVAARFMKLVNGEKTYDDVDHLLNELKRKMNIDENEANYVKQLLHRAKTFNPNIIEEDQQLRSQPKDTRLIVDIFNVYNCFLFSNFQFQQCNIGDLKVTSKNQNKSYIEKSMI
eukprot:188885_1